MIMLKHSEGRSEHKQLARPMTYFAGLLRLRFGVRDPWIVVICPFRVCRKRVWNERIDAGP